MEAFSFSFEHFHSTGPQSNEARSVDLAGCSVGWRLVVSGGSLDL
jgi:hypothetical protein